MKITATDEQFEISVARTPEELQKAIRALIEEHAKLLGHLAGDSNEPLIGGNGRADVRIIDGAVQIGLACSFGWVLTRFDAAGACGMAGSIGSCTQQLLISGAAQAEVSSGRISLH